MNNDERLKQANEIRLRIEENAEELDSVMDNQPGFLELQKHVYAA